MVKNFGQNLFLWVTVINYYACFVLVAEIILCISFAMVKKTGKTYWTKSFLSEWQKYITIYNFCHVKTPGEKPGWLSGRSILLCIFFVMINHPGKNMFFFWVAKLYVSFFYGKNNLDKTCLYEGWKYNTMYTDPLPKDNIEHHLFKLWWKYYYGKWLSEWLDRELLKDWYEILNDK